MMALHLMAPSGAANFDACRCGGTLHIGTDGDGDIIESCDAGCPPRIVPRVAAVDLQLAVYTDPVIAQLRADAEAKRQKYSFCANGCGNRVSRAQDDLCARCSTQRRYAKDVVRRVALSRERAS